MNFEEYRLVTNETAVYPKDKEELYLALGLMSELGEIAGKLKKIIRDKNGDFEEKDRLELEKECGDVFWYLAQISNMLFPHSPVKKLVCNGEFENDIYQSLNDVFSAAAYLHTCMLASYYDTHIELIEEREIQSYKTLALFEWFCIKLGISPSSARQKNINKLFDRKKRGMIQGSGDDR